MKNLFLWLLLASPVWIFSQDIKNGTISFDFGKKKKAQRDSIQQQQPADEIEDTVVARHRKPKKHSDTVQQINTGSRGYDYKKNGVFSAIFNAGLNAAQIDGDNEYGYKYFGAEFGVGALARFHKIFSLSLELNYAMKGGRARLNPNTVSLEKYCVQLDYIEAALALNAHYKQLLMFSVGVTPGYLTRYKEVDYDGINVTNQNNPLGQPRKFGLCGFGAVHVIIKQHYAIEFSFAYSMLKIREALPYTRVNGEYNNYLSLRFMYILTGKNHSK